MVRGVYIQRPASERMSVESAVSPYVVEMTPTKRPSTQAGERRRAGILITNLGRYSLAALTPEIIAGYRDRRLAGEVAGSAANKPRSNNTGRLELALLGHMFNVAIKKWGLGLTYNPVQSIRRPAPGPGRNRRPQRGEEARLLAAVDAHSNPTLGRIVRIALETGMRSSEILTLQRQQVDLERRTVRLLETKNTTPGTVPLRVEAARIFREALGNPIRPIDTRLIFLGEPGRDCKRRSYRFSRMWTSIRNELQMADLHFHDLRHEAVSRLVEGGLSDQEVSAISGHKSMQMLKLYTHPRAEDLLGKLDAIAGKG